MSPGTPPAEPLAPPPTGLRELLAWALRRRRRFRVAGRSMCPTLAPGDLVFLAPHRVPQVGDLVVARHPSRTDQWWVKRVAERREGDRLWLVGDNPSESTDSRTQGAVPPALVRGTVTSVLRAPSADPA